MKCYRHLLSASIVALSLAACGGEEAENQEETNQNHGETDAVVYEIDHYRVPCTGEASLLCLRVREKGKEDFELFYDGIEGFDFQWGRVYELKIAVEDVENPPQDASAFSYELVEVISEEEVDGGTSFDLRISPVAPGTSPFLEIDEGEPTGALLDGREFHCEPAAVCDDAQTLLDDESEFVASVEYAEEIDEPLVLTAAEAVEE